MSINTNGLTALSTNNTTWASPLVNEMPVAVASQIRGGLWLVPGGDDADNQLTGIPGIMLQDGMIVYLQTGYNEAGGITREGASYYRYNNTDARPASGVLPNTGARWTRIEFTGGGGDGITTVADIAALNALVDLDADPVVEPDNGQIFIVLDPRGADDADPAIDNLPAGIDWDAADTANLRLTVSWDADNNNWDFVRIAPANEEAAFVNVTGDTMTGNLVMDDTDAADSSIRFTADNRGGAGNPSVAFSDAATGTGGNFDTGVFQRAADTLSVSIAGTERASMDATDLTISENGQWQDDATAGVRVGRLNDDGGRIEIKSDGDDVYEAIVNYVGGNQDDDANFVVASNGALSIGGDPLGADGPNLVINPDGGMLHNQAVIQNIDPAPNVPNADADWQIADSNVWLVPDAVATITFPRDPDDATTDPTPGQSGIFVLAGAVEGWTDLDPVAGGQWLAVDGTPPTGAANTIIPFYVQANNIIMLGRATTVS